MSQPSDSKDFKTSVLGAAEFVPSWLKKPAPAAPTSTPAPAPKPQAQQASTPSPAPAPTTQSRQTPAGQTMRKDPFGMPQANSAIPWKTPSPSPAGKQQQQQQKSTPKSQPSQQKPVASQGNSSQKKGLSPDANSFMPAASLGPSLATSSDNKPQGVSSGWAKKEDQVKKQPQKNADGAQTYEVKKSDAEIIETAKSSKLAALLNAAVFIPGQKKGTNSSKVSPLLLPQSNNNTEMLLGDCWCLYYLDAVAAADNEFDPTLVYRIDAVPAFWQTFNNITEPGFLPLQSTMYLFRDDINPMWEDPKNSPGGMWRLKVPEDRIDGVWLNLCCRTVGEGWQSEHRNSINGIVLKVRERGYWVEVWVSEKNENFPTDVLSAIEQFYPSFNIDYLQHEEMQKKKAEALALAAASPKTAKKKKRH